METLALAVTWLAVLGFSEARAVLFNASLHGMDRLRAGSASRQWRVVSEYLRDELLREDPERSREILLSDLAGMLVEEILRLYNYWPDEWDLQ